MKPRPLVLVLAALVAALAAAAAPASNGAGTANWYIINSNGGVIASFATAKGLSAGSTQIVLERGTASPALLDWTQPGSATLVVYADHGPPVVTYAIRNAWPTKYTEVSLNADKNEISVESLTIAHEGMR